MRQGIPAISGSAEFTDAGNLMSYGPVQRDVYAKLGGYADKLLRGAKPDELPVENPTRSEMVFLLHVACALKMKVPQAMLLRADRVIEGSRPPLERGLGLRCTRRTRSSCDVLAQLKQGCQLTASLPRRGEFITR